MIRKLIIFALLLGVGIHGHAQCDLPLAPMGALYEIAEENRATGKIQKSHLNIWRRGGQVAYEFPELGVTEIWSRAPTQGMYLVRYFDQHSRGIEYQPGELGYAHPANAWQDKQQLVATALLDSLNPVGSEGAGCELVESYTGKSRDAVVALKWLPQLRLPRDLQVETPASAQHWQLLETVRSPQRIDAVFASRQKYATTDYADIGDNESDPFLMKMIRMGFIEHGSHGFYDEHGHALEAASH
jgi:hypothetical protein